MRYTLGTQKERLNFLASPEEGESTPTLPRPVFEAEVYVSALQYPCSLQGSECPCRGPGD